MEQVSKDIEFCVPKPVKVGLRLAGDYYDYHHWQECEEREVKEPTVTCEDKEDEKTADEEKIEEEDNLEDNEWKLWTKHVQDSVQQIYISKTFSHLIRN